MQTGTISMGKITMLVTHRTIQDTTTNLEDSNMGKVNRDNLHMGLI